MDPVIDQFTRPWATRRGIEPSDGGHDALLVRAGPAEVSAAFVRHGARSQPEALGTEVTIGPSIGIVFRLRGHGWTTVLGTQLGPGIPAQLSRDLDAPVLRVVSWEADIEYDYFGHGDRVEHLSGNYDRVETFESQRRSQASLGALSGHAAADAFVKAHDAYVSDLVPAYFFGDGHTLPDPKPGMRMRLGNPGEFLMVPGRGAIISVPEIERLDYLVLPP